MKKINSKSKIITNIIKILVIIIFLGLTIYACIVITPYFRGVSAEEALDKLKNKIFSYEPYSWLVLLGIQVVQIIIAVIPGEPIEIISGIVYGTFGGLFLCLVGILIGSITVFYFVRWLGKDFINKIIESKKLEKLKFLNNNKNLEMLVFILFFIPGTPKDILTYIIPITKIKPMRFFVLATFSRIPSIITSTYMGSKIDQGEMAVAILIFVITAIIGIVGIIVHNRLVNHQNKKTNSD